MRITIDRHERVPMPDGVRLAADVFRPLGDGRLPVVLIRTPYDRGNAPTFGTQLNAIRLAESGYAVVTQDVRGRFGSEGVFDPFRLEGPDGAATVAWAAEQSWSNGVVAMAGTSYCGYAQVLAARERPEALRAIVPTLCPLDARDGWVYHGDAFLLGFNLAWMLGTMVPADPGTADPATALAAYDDWENTVRRPVGAHPELAGAPVGAAYGDWLAHRDDAAWWAPLSGRGAGRHDAAALVIGGWFDIFAPSTVELYAELAAGDADPAQLLIGPWDHSPLPLASAAGESEFGSAAMVDLPGLEQRWLDHVLRDGDPPLAAAARTFVTGWNRWEDWPRWPPEASTWTLYTVAGGGLEPSAPAAGADRFRTSASDPAPTVGGLLYPRPRHLRPGQFDQAARSGRPDVLGYVTEPQPADVLLAGPVTAELWSDTTGRGADVVATLVDLAPNGRAVNIAEGVRRQPDAGAEPRRFDVSLGHVAHALRRGHRLRLDVAGANFPRIDRLPAFGRCDRTLFHGGATPSRLLLPVAG